MAKKKTTRRWSGAGDGLIHEYVRIFGFSPDVVRVREGLGFVAYTHCGIYLDKESKGIWCRKPVTCLGCFANAGYPVVMKL